MPVVLLVDLFYTPTEVARFRDVLAGSAAVVQAERDDLTEFARLASAADVLVNTVRPIDAATLAQAPRVRFIQQLGAGYDSIDLAAVNAAGVLVACNPGANAVGVAEHTVLLMLAAVKNLGWIEQVARGGRFPPDELPPGGVGDLAGATIGLVGMGAIGQAVAERLRPFDVRLMYTARSRLPAAREEHLDATWVTFPELLRVSDIVSLHLPLTAATKQLIGPAELATMRRGAMLINTARGGLVDEAALRQAIESGHLAGAGLDVISDEQSGRNPFADLPQVFVTLHLAGSSRGSTTRMIERSAANIHRFLAGKPVRDLIPGLTSAAGTGQRAAALQQ
jgi:phosphoglycerate dehydrogenase-like enzyme